MNKHIKMKPKITRTIAVAIFLLTGWGLIREFNSLFGCGGEIYAMAPSPNKTLVAYAFERDCGATTDSVSFVVLKGAREKLDLSADLNRAEIVFQSVGNYRPTLKWVSEDTLQISFENGAPSSSEIWFQSIKWNQYTIGYRGL